MSIVIFKKTSYKELIDPQEPTVNVGKKGDLFFNKAAVDLMQIEQGNCLSFGQDEKTFEWYLIIDDKDGWLVRNSRGQLRCASVFFARSIAQTFNVELPRKFTLSKEKDGFLLTADWEE